MAKAKTKKRKYGIGSGRMGTSYIEDPSTTIAENNIMMAKATQESTSNKWLPIVAMVSQLAQTALTSGAGKSSTTGEGLDTGDDDYTGEGDDGDGIMKAMGSSNANGQVEVEGKEVVETPDGQVAKVQGASHENGGVNMTLPAGTKIYSKRVEKFGKSMAERKEARERKKTNLEKLVSGNNTDIAIKNTYDRTMVSLEKEEEDDLRTQEMFGMMAAVHEFAYGTSKDGTPKYGVTRKKYDEQDTFPMSSTGERYGNQNLDLLVAPPLPAITENPSLKNNFEGDVIQPNTSTIASLDKNNGTTPKEDMEITEGTFPASQPLNKDVVKGNKEDEGSFLDNANLPRLGDSVSLLGDLYSTFKPMQNTLANRASDTPNVNAFRDFGKDALEANLMAMEMAASNRSSLYRRITSQSRGLKRSGRNSARGVNQTRALDLAANMNVNEANQSANDSFVNTMTQLLGSKSQLENVQDQVVMTGNQEKDLNDRKDKDNFYTQMGKDIATKGEGIQQMGKDVNSIEENNMMMNIMNNLSKYGLAFDSKGNIIETNKGK